MPNHGALVCILDAIPRDERPAHLDLLARLFRERCRERQDIPNGYAFRFDAAAFEDVARFVGNERRCCPFLSFTIELAPDPGPLWLRISGPPRTRAFLEAELPALSHEANR